MAVWRPALVVAVALALTTVQSGDSVAPLPRREASGVHRFFVFEANRGQFDSRVRYAARHGRNAAFATDEGMTLVRRETRRDSKGAAVRMRLVGGANRTPDPESLLAGTVSTFIGRDPAGWRTGIPTFAALRYRDVRPGIDIRYYEQAGQLEYDIVVRPGADDRNLVLVFDGADRVRAHGEDLHIFAGDHELVMKRPVAYLADDPDTHVATSFTVREDRQIALAIGDHDPTKTLIVDPVLAWGTYLGGTSIDAVANGSIDVDPSGNVYVSGFTASSDLPKTLGAFDSTLDGDGDAFVAKIAPTGSSLVYCAYLGGSGSDDVKEVVRPVAADTKGNAYVTGRTTSSDFPTTSGAMTSSYRGGITDAFVAKISPTGDALLYATFLGGDDGDFGYAIVADDAGAAYVGGHTRSTNFPATPGAAGTTGSGFVAKLTPAGDAIVYSTRFALNLTYVLALARDSEGNVYAAGEADNQFIPTAGAYQEAFKGETFDAFVAKIDPTGTKYLYATRLGGTGDDRAYALAIDALGQAHVGGVTQSADFPTTAGTVRTVAGPPTDGFVAKLDAAGSALLYSTLLGRDGNDRVAGLALDAAGNCFAAGSTGPGYAVLNSCVPEPKSDGAGFVTELTPAGAMGRFSTFFPSAVVALKGDGQGALYGLSAPTAQTIDAVEGSFDATHNGFADAFAFELLATPTNGAPGCQPCSGDLGSGAERACTEAANPICRRDGPTRGTCGPFEPAVPDAAPTTAPSSSDAPPPAAVPDSDGCSCRLQPHAPEDRSIALSIAGVGIVIVIVICRRRSSSRPGC